MGFNSVFKGLTNNNSLDESGSRFNKAKEQLLLVFTERGQHWQLTSQTAL